MKIKKSRTLSLVVLIISALSGHVSAQCGVVPDFCDYEVNNVVDVEDINAIIGAYGTPVDPYDFGDVDGDGVITVSDAQECAERCESGDCEIVGGSKPNILLIIADDLSYDHYGFAGHTTIQTPSIDALAAQSVRFPATYVSSFCRPSLATLLTGLPEHRHGVTYHVGDPLGDFPTLADRLQSAGYSSYQAGKFFEGPPDSRGFTDFLPYGGIGSFFNIGNVFVGRTTLQPIYDFMAQTTSPWFIWFSPYMPHTPHNAPDEYRTLYEGLGLDAATIKYFAMISWFDAVVGELLQEISEDTIVIYLSDNGYVQSAVSGEAHSSSKNSSFEHGIRTWLLVRDPSTAAVEHTELANSWDVTTTILSLAGVYHDDLPGQALLAPPLSDLPAYGSRSSLVFQEPAVDLLERWIRVGDWKLVDVEVGDDRLYNLALDPTELMNQIDAPESAQQQLDLRIELGAVW